MLGSAHTDGLVVVHERVASYIPLTRRVSRGSLLSGCNRAMYITRAMVTLDNIVWQNKAANATQSLYFKFLGFALLIH